MARPRVFISSTFFDLKQVRSDLERFIKDSGYDPVLHERGNVTYGSKEKLEEYCYREIQQVEILVSIIGGRFGSNSVHQPYSISQQELRTAYDLGIQVFIFVENNVLAEYQTYLKNKQVSGITFNFADDSAVYRFLEEIHALPNNNPITGFGSSQDITIFLREQWAGLFQRFLQNQRQQKEIRLVRDLQANMDTLNQLVTYLTEEKRNSNEAIRGILLANHPLFSSLQSLLKPGYRVFFTNHNELSRWLRARGFGRIDPEGWDSPDFEEWINRSKTPYVLIKIATLVFDGNGDLVIYTAQQWNKDWISMREYTEPTIPSGPLGLADDDVPF